MSNFAWRITFLVLLLVSWAVLFYVYAGHGNRVWLVVPMMMISGVFGYHSPPLLREIQKRQQPQPERCRECTAPIGGGHTGYCSKSMMRSGTMRVVGPEDCR